MCRKRSNGSRLSAREARPAVQLAHLSLLKPAAPLTAHLGLSIHAMQGARFVYEPGRYEILGPRDCNLQPFCRVIDGYPTPSLLGYKVRVTAHPGLTNHPFVLGYLYEGDLVWLAPGFCSPTLLPSGEARVWICFGNPMHDWEWGWITADPYAMVPGKSEHWISKVPDYPTVAPCCDAVIPPSLRPEYDLDNSMLGPSETAAPVQTYDTGDLGQHSHEESSALEWLDTACEDMELDSLPLQNSPCNEQVNDAMKKEGKPHDALVETDGSVGPEGDKEEKEDTESARANAQQTMRSRCRLSIRSFSSAMVDANNGSVTQSRRSQWASSLRPPNDRQREMDLPDTPAEKPLVAKRLVEPERITELQRINALNLEPALLKIDNKPSRTQSSSWARLAQRNDSAEHDRKGSFRCSLEIISRSTVLPQTAGPAGFLCNRSGVGDGKETSKRCPDAGESRSSRDHDNVGKSSYGQRQRKTQEKQTVTCLQRPSGVSTTSSSSTQHEWQ